MTLGMTSMPRPRPPPRARLCARPRARARARGARGGLTSLSARCLATGREPMISRIRLAWWREALERLDRAPPPAEPVLQALAAHVLPAGVSGAELAAMEEGWAMLLSDDVARPRTSSTRYAEARGGLLFRYSAPAARRGRTRRSSRPARRWALVDLARHSADPARRDAALDAAARIEAEATWPRAAAAARHAGGARRGAISNAARRRLGAARIAGADAAHAPPSAHRLLIRFRCI